MECHNFWAGKECIAGPTLVHDALFTAPHALRASPSSSHSILINNAFSLLFLPIHAILILEVFVWTACMESPFPVSYWVFWIYVFSLREFQGPKISRAPYFELQNPLLNIHGKYYNYDLVFSDVGSMNTFQYEGKTTNLIVYIIKACVASKSSSSATVSR